MNWKMKTLKKGFFLNISNQTKKIKNFQNFITTTTTTTTRMMDFRILFFRFLKTFFLSVARFAKSFSSFTFFFCLLVWKTLSHLTNSSFTHTHTQSKSLIWNEMNECKWWQKKTNHLMNYIHIYIYTRKQHFRWTRNMVIIIIISKWSLASYEKKTTTIATT